MRINMSKEEPMGIAYPPRPLAEPRSGRYAGCKSAASEVFGCISRVRGAYAAVGNENYCGNLLWQSSVTLLPPPEMTTWMIVGIVVGAFPVSEFSHKPVANMIHYTPYESGQ